MKKNIMLGSSLKLSIVTDSDASGEIFDEFYFPNGTWCILLGNNGGR
jgi:hypothetical protein